MYSNRVWDLIEAHEGIKPIGCKWICKRKREVDGNVKTYKDMSVSKDQSEV